MFGKIAPTLDITVGHSVRHRKNGKLKWKSLTPEQMRQVIQRRQTHMAGVIDIDEWAHRSRLPELNEVGAGYFFWYDGGGQHHGNAISASCSWCVECRGRTVPTILLCFHDKLQNVYDTSRGVLAYADHFVVIVYVMTCVGKCWPCFLHISKA